MTNNEMAKALYGLAKNMLAVNHQERELVKAAAKRLEIDQLVNEKLRTDVEQLKAQVEEFKYLLAEREGIQDDTWKTEDHDDGNPAAVAPGTADEDFFADDGYWDDLCS